MKNKLKLYIGSFSMLLVCLFSTIITVTGAWYTDTQSTEAVTITVGNEVTISLTSALAPGTILPGSELEVGNGVTATVAEGSSALYLRAKVTATSNLASNLYSVSMSGTNWTLNSDDGYYYYTDETSISGSTSITELISLSENQSTLISVMVSVPEELLSTELIPGEEISCSVTFQAIQSENMPSTYTLANMTTKWSS